MARAVLAIIFFATMAVVSGHTLYAASRSGKIEEFSRSRSSTVRRANKPIWYWFAMFSWAFAGVVSAAIAMLVGFLLVHHVYLW